MFRILSAGKRGMEGCNKYCTYCVVPYTRGEEVSRPADDILFEIAQLAAQGVREVNLLGQNVNAWRGENYDGTTGSFAELLRLVAAIDGIDRIRFTTSHPMEFTDDIIDVYRDTPELVSFLHLPIQCGSDRVLNLMGRPHTVLEYKSTIRKLREARPDIQISSDFIVGFPGETDDDFERTMIPRSQMITLKRNQTLDECLDVIIESAHSRFPVISEDKDHIEGILMAKDLLPFMRSDAEDFSMKALFKSPNDKALN
jgi:2-methylthioadenine synthetase